MTYIPAINTVKVVIEQLFGVSELANIVYMLKTGGWNVGAMTDLAADIIDWWTDNVAPLVSNQLAMTGVTVTDLTTSTSPTISVPVSPAVGGTLTGSVSPANAAAVVTFRTANRGRSSRGRNYIGGMTENTVQTPTDITTVEAAGLIAAYEALAGVETANSCQHVVASYWLDKAARATALLQEVLSYTCDTASDSQRRRLRGRGV